MLCCIGGVCVPYTAVVPLLLLALRWCLAKLAALGLLPSSVVELLNLKQFDQNSCCAKETSKDSNDAVASCCAGGPSAVKELESDGEFDELLKQKSKVVIKFSASWCKPCHKIQPFYQQTSSQFSETVRFLTIDVDDFDGIANKYGVAMMPTFLVVQGEKVLGTYRGSSEPELETFLQAQLS